MKKVLISFPRPQAGVLGQEKCRYSFPLLLILWLFLHIFLLIVNPSLVAFFGIVFLFIIFPIKIIILFFTQKKRSCLYIEKYFKFYLIGFSILLFSVIFLHINIYQKFYIFEEQSNIEVFQNLKEEVITEIINQDKKSQIVLLLSNVAKEKIDISLNKLENKYRYEREKFNKYCNTQSKYCKFKVSIKPKSWYSKVIFEPSNVSLSITYLFDKESMKFFNSIQYVGNNYNNYHIDENDFYHFSMLGYKMVQYVPTDEEISMKATTFSSNFIEKMIDGWFLWKKENNSVLINQNQVLKMKKIAIKRIK